MKYLGDYVDDATVYIYFTTNDSSGGAVAPSTAFEAADVVIYKNNSPTQKATTNGITMTSPFDAITGLHLVAIDMSNDTGDAGFWASGNDYSAILSPDETVDGQTVVHPLGQWSNENRSALRPTTAGRTLDVAATGEAGLDLGNVTGTLGNANVGWVDANNRVDVGSWLGTAAATPTVAGVPEVDMTHLGGVAQSATDLKDFADAGYDPATNKVQGVVLVDTTTTNSDMRGTDSAALATVCTEARLAELDAGNIPSDVDAILVDTGTTLPLSLPAALTKGTADSGTTTTMVDAARTEADTDYWKGSFIRFTSGTISGQTRLITGFTPASDTITFAPATTQAVGTNTYEILPAGAAELLAATQASIDAIEADTNELQTDWADGGRLDVILDARMAEASINTTAGAVDTVTAVTNAVGVSSLTSAAITDVWATDTLTEAYAADGAAAKPNELFYMIWSAIHEFAISGTTITSKKLDGTTTAFTHTLDDGTNPTSRTRAT